MSDAGFGAWLAGARRRLGVSCATLARRAGVSDETVRQAEHGRKVRESSRVAIERAVAELDAEAERPTLEERVAELERQVRELRGEG